MTTEERVEAIRARRAASTQGAWAWFGNMKFNQIHLATQRGGRRFIMQFWRWGMQNAQPVFQSAHVMRPLPDLVERGELTVKDYPPHEIIDTPHPDMRLSLIHI